MNLNLQNIKDNQDKKDNQNEKDKQDNQNEKEGIVKKYIPSEIKEWDDAEMLQKNLLRGIYSYGFEKPSPIQKKALLTVIDGKDTIAQANQTGGSLRGFMCDF